MQPDDIYVGVDSGIEYCLSNDIVPTLLVGDFDSVDNQMLADDRLVAVPRNTYPARKASSDLELALQSLIPMGVSKATVLGASGGRTDHMLFNWLLPLSAEWPFAIEIQDHSVIASIVTAQRPYSYAPELGQLLSIVAISEASGVTTTGLEYPLDNATLKAGCTLGLSNVVSEADVHVSVDEGMVWVMLVNSVS